MNRQFRLIIVDDDIKKYALTDMITDDLAWNERVVQEQEKGRNIRCFSCDHDDKDSLQEWEIRCKVSRTTIDAIISPPEDTSAIYEGKIPAYANKANRRRIVKILCRDKCNTTRYAELNQDYPDQETLRNAKHGEFRATCLKCGYVASDNYNWIR